MDLDTKCASANIGRAIDTISAQPSAKTCSATSGELIRFEVITGMLTLPISFLVTQANAARGTEVAIVGMRASCQPTPVFMMVAPAASMAWANWTISVCVDPLGIRSIIERRKMIMKSSPTAARVRRTTSTGRRILFSYDPPHRSVRLLVWVTRN